MSSKEILSVIKCDSELIEVCHNISAVGGAVKPLPIIAAFGKLRQRQGLETSFLAFVSGQPSTDMLFYAFSGLGELQAPSGS